MPGRRDCSLIGYGRIHHRSEHHEPRPRVARWASGQAPDGRSRRALSQRQQHADAQHGQRRLDDQRHRRLASPSCLEVEPLAGDEPPTRDVPAPLAQPGLVRNWQMVHVLPLFLFALHRCLRDVIRTRCRNGLNPALRQGSRRGLELSGGYPAIGQHHPVTSPSGRIVAGNTRRGQAACTPISKHFCCYQISLVPQHNA